MKKIIFLFCLLFITEGCSQLKKTAGKDSATQRSVAGLREGQDISRLPRETREKRVKQALFKMLREGKAVISKGIVMNKNNQPVCGMDLRNQRGLVPQFARPAPGNFRSAVTFKKGLRACNANERKPIALKVSQNGFVLEGTQTAVLPLFAAPAIAGCIIGSVSEAVSKELFSIHEYGLPAAGAGAVTGVIGGAGDVLIKGTKAAASSWMVPSLRQLGAAITVVGSTGGAALGFLTSMVCGQAVFMVEMLAK